jgi:hypothetical protein
VGQIAGPPLEQAGHQRVGTQPLLERVHEMEEQRVQRDRDQGTGDDELEPLLRKETERQPEGPQDERELADLGETGTDRHGDPDRISEQGDDRELGDRLGDDHEEHDGRDGQRHREQR